MALKSSREGLRKELVDYLGNLIVNEKLQKDIVESIDSFLKVDLLWTNANPLSPFSAQRIELDISSYDYIYCIFRVYAQNAELYTAYLFKIGFKYSLYNSGVRNSSRNIQITSDSFITEDAYIYLEYNNESNKYLDDLILTPYQIYGVK